MSAPLFRIASGAAGYPGDASRQWLAAAEREGLLPAPAAALLAADGAELESDYVQLFDFGVTENPLHETGYGRDRSLAIGERLADVAGFYRAFGVDSGGEERADHLAVELEFYAWMLLKGEHLATLGDEEGQAIVLDARRKFLAEHLGPLAISVAGRPAIAAHARFGPLFAWIGELVAAEGAALGLAFEPLAILPPRLEPDEVTCAVAGQPAAAGRLPVLAD